jgi:VanZ family protein
MKPFLIARMALTLGACPALLIAIVVLSLVPAHDRPVTALPHSLEHLTIFFAAGLAFGIGYPQRRLFQFVALLAFTAAIELAQLLVPGRHARLSDFLIDAGGVTVGLWIGFLASRKLTAVIAGVTPAHRVRR